MWSTVGITICILCLVIERAAGNGNPPGGHDTHNTGGNANPTANQLPHTLAPTHPVITGQLFTDTTYPESTTSAATGSQTTAYSGSTVSEPPTVAPTTVPPPLTTEGTPQIQPALPTSAGCISYNATKHPCKDNSACSLSHVKEVICPDEKEAFYCPITCGCCPVAAHDS
ncbi:uncharacterized protein LOC127865579 [Dreissena polymorpha]|uniref:ShKT domain-containing protein n=1 Tax=Dreissena polymorpha TaxID=45954 RepID=A0A9D4LJW2_DREPO|nr:uncharacterized protein LOC127865579 [Dreissena polymorpha]KAH3860092.1 hypothetical protein DPMN_022985 [Dreissena polymorpha]